jgi:murein DD-endopeptidase MepM/ murein hydrolase activator NlpD
MAIDPTQTTTVATQRQQRNAELKKTCKQFESVLTYQMLKSMRDTVDKSDLFGGGEGEEIYESLLDQELSNKMTGYGSNSLAEALYRQLSRMDSMNGSGYEADTKTGTASSGTPATEPKAEHVSATEVKPSSTKQETASQETTQAVQPESHTAASIQTASVSGSSEQTDVSDSTAKDTRPDWPVKSVMSSRYGYRRDPFTKDVKFHSGIDLAAPEGSDVKAATSGKVVVSRNMEGYGNIVAVDDGQGTVTIYAHNEKNLVKAGDQVEKGSLIAKVGSTGRSTGAHLHFEVRKDGKKIDPLAFLGVA